MSYFKIKKLQKEHISPYNVKKFLFKMIQDEFGFGFIPEYHQDIKNMEDYYLDPERNNFFLAIDHDTEKIIGTIGIRAYDRDYPIFKSYTILRQPPVYGEFLLINHGVEMEWLPP